MSAVEKVSFSTTLPAPSSEDDVSVRCLSSSSDPSWSSVIIEMGEAAGRVEGDRFGDALRFGGDAVLRLGGDALHRGGDALIITTTGEELCLRLVMLTGDFLLGAGETRTGEVRLVFRFRGTGSGDHE